MLHYFAAAHFLSDYFRWFTSLSFLTDIIDFIIARFLSTLFSLLPIIDTPPPLRHFDYAHVFIILR
jgi:hypothetical protein